MFEWVGGAYTDVENVTLENVNLQGITDLFTTHCPLDMSMNLRFFYMVGFCKFELDKDMEVSFAWSVLHTGDLDFMTNIYCISDYMISPSVAQSISQSVQPQPDEHYVIEGEPPLLPTQEDLTQHEVTSPIKTTVMSPRRSSRLAKVNESTEGGPSSNTRGVELRKTPIKKVAKPKTTTVKARKEIIIDDHDSDEDTAKLQKSKFSY